MRTFPEMKEKSTEFSRHRVEHFIVLWLCIHTLVSSVLLYVSGFFDKPSYLTFIIVNFFSIYGYFGGFLICDLFVKPLNEDGDRNSGGY